MYVSYSQGFRSGFPQNANAEPTPPATGLPPAKPDRLHNYEIGSKGTLFDGRLEFDTAVYYMKWNDVQLPLSVTFQNIQVSGLVNSQSASGMGVDFQVAARPLDGFNTGFTFSWNNLTLDAAVYSGGSLLYQKGDRLVQSPEYTAGAFANYSFPFGSSGLVGRLSVSANYTSGEPGETYVGTQTFANTSLNGNSIWIGRASFAVDFRSHWSADAYVDNFNNENGAVFRDPYTADWALRVRPRTAGLQVDYHFR
jgi:outer membrane receptor protein involved in Fe transport